VENSIQFEEDEFGHYVANIRLAAAEAPAKKPTQARNREASRGTVASQPAGLSGSRARSTSTPMVSSKRAVSSRNTPPSEDLASDVPEAQWPAKAKKSGPSWEERRDADQENGLFPRFAACFAGGPAKRKRRTVAQLYGWFDEIYDARFMRDSQMIRLEAIGQAPPDAESRFGAAFPEFVFDFLSKKYGLKKLVDQTCADLIHSIAALRRNDVHGEIFAKFLEESYDGADLLFFLYVRNNAEKEISKGGRSAGGRSARSETKKGPRVLTMKQCVAVTRAVFGPDQGQLQDALFQGLDEHFQVAGGGVEATVALIDFLSLAVHIYHSHRQDAPAQDWIGADTAAPSSNMAPISAGPGAWRSSWVQPETNARSGLASPPLDQQDTNGWTPNVAQPMPAPQSWVPPTDETQVATMMQDLLRVVQTHSDDTGAPVAQAHVEQIADVATKIVAKRRILTEQSNEGWGALAPPTPLSGQFPTPGAAEGQPWSDGIFGQAAVPAEVPAGFQDVERYLANINKYKGAIKEFEQKLTPPTGGGGQIVKGSPTSNGTSPEAPGQAGQVSLAEVRQMVAAKRLSQPHPSKVSPEDFEENLETNIRLLLTEAVEEAVFGAVRPQDSASLSKAVLKQVLADAVEEYASVSDGLMEALVSRASQDWHDRLGISNPTEAQQEQYNILHEAFREILGSTVTAQSVQGFCSQLVRTPELVERIREHLNRSLSYARARATEESLKSSSLNFGGWRAAQATQAVTQTASA